jgi:hypothetical protein|tara:strand:+ start:119 stop:616 length:498 start_codon:yes stop_codon:yes gene_type:complete
MIPKEYTGFPSIPTQIAIPPSEIAISLTSNESIRIIISADASSLPFSFQFFTCLAAVFAEDVTDDLIFGLVESAEESPAGTGNWSCSTTVAIYTSAHGSGLATHRARVAEVRDVFMSDCIATSITDDSTETLTCVAVQNFSFTQRVEDNYFIGEISFDVYCYGSE